MIESPQRAANQETAPTLWGALIEPDTMREQLAARLAQGTTLAACREMESELSYGRHAGPAPYSARRAAVLVLLYPADGDWWLPLTVRPTALAAHAGQISLPGGLIEPDELSEQAALRELHEELGVESAEIDVIGQLAELYIMVSNFLVMPWVAIAPARPRFVPNPCEVDHVLELSLRDLLNPHTRRTTLRTASGIVFESPYYALAEHQIWGATAMMLAGLRALMKEIVQ